MVQREGRRWFCLFEEKREIARAPSISALLQIVPGLVGRFQRPAPRDRADRWDGGASLIELAVVVSILALGLLVSRPLLEGLVADWTTRSELGALRAGVLLCRQIAIGNGLQDAVARLGPAGLTCDNEVVWTPSELTGWAIPPVSWTYSGFGSTGAMAPIPIGTPAGPATLHVRPSGSVAVTGP